MGRESGHEPVEPASCGVIGPAGQVSYEHHVGLGRRAHLEGIEEPQDLLEDLEQALGA